MYVIGYQGVTLRQATIGWKERGSYARCSLISSRNPGMGDAPVRLVEFIIQKLRFVGDKRFYLNWFLYEVLRLNTFPIEPVATVGKH